VFAKRTRFDPILPDDREGVGPMGLYAWSNIVDLGGDIAVKPIDELVASIGYRYVALASAEDRWSTAALVPVGAAPNNEARPLGHELDAALTLVPWDPIEFGAGYGLFIFGEGAKAILESAHRGGGEVSHWAYVQARIHAP
jgi:hypothetical protein